MITVLGAGAFGTSLAISLARTGQPVALWARSGVTEMQASRVNTRRLPSAPFPESLTVIDALSSMSTEGPVLLAVPMQQLRGFLTEHADLLANRTLIAACKGLDLETHLGPVETIRATLPRAKAALLTGPSFAADIARGLPTALTLACKDAVLGKTLQQALTTPNLRIYRTTDTAGAELGGALKNVIAIACGACIGKGMGDSARAALMTRGFAEMQRLALRRGALPETLTGLAGFGDLALTCTSALSRNYRFGLALGRQEHFDTSITVEGIPTANAVVAWAKELNVDMPICSAVAVLSTGKISVSEALQNLLSRPLKEE
ncbi:NAD(P)H-dependent glycerol-3-phosphate dehydrogenase [Lentibacter sp. XHP0401]|uniref:NAD(P)H-dependent glycerol-3-phosphate dehydrogenase n=1 Tax=Lentibacter sp. XHP0401 TaxID=2984334 RepID=UPI0021E9ADC3|nr:NAD(P)H-dependent glycerol-3-phosphate dehydrogenase [Lentibacter sp. XHP0401]MCV2892656.1 NAD(P)-dependent glycerol-3-phosphate dehydrogenase [Lentibacter sp. XHP0401]